MAGFLRKKTKKIPPSATTATFTTQLYDQQLQQQRQHQQGHPTAASMSASDSNYATPLFARFATQGQGPGPGGNQMSQDPSKRIVSGPMQLTSAAALKRETSARANHGVGAGAGEVQMERSGSGAGGGRWDNNRMERRQSAQAQAMPPSRMPSQQHQRQPSQSSNGRPPPVQHAYTQPGPGPASYSHPSAPHPQSHSQPASVQSNRRGSSRASAAPPPASYVTRQQHERSRTLSLQDKDRHVPPAGSVVSTPSANGSVNGALGVGGGVGAGSRQSQVINPAMANRNVSDTALPDTARRYSTTSNFNSGSGRPHGHAPPNAYFNNSNFPQGAQGAPGANRSNSIGQPPPSSYSHSNHHYTQSQSSSYQRPPSSAMSDLGPSQSQHSYPQQYPQQQSFGYGQGAPPVQTDRGNGFPHGQYQANGQTNANGNRQSVYDANGVEERRNNRLSTSTAMSNGTVVRGAGSVGGGSVQRQVSSITSPQGKPRTLTKVRPKEKDGASRKGSPPKRSPTLPSIPVPPEEFVEYTASPSPNPRRASSLSPPAPQQQQQHHVGRRQSVQAQQNGYPYPQQQQFPSVSNGPGPLPPQMQQPPQLQPQPQQPQPPPYQQPQPQETGLRPSASVRTVNNNSLGPVRGKPRIFAAMEENESLPPAVSTSPPLPPTPLSPLQRGGPQFLAPGYPPLPSFAPQPQAPPLAPPNPSPPQAAAEYIRPNTKIEPASAPPAVARASSTSNSTPPQQSNGQYGKSGRYDLSRYPLPSQVNSVLVNSVGQAFPGQRPHQGGTSQRQQQQRPPSAYSEVSGGVGSRKRSQSASQIPQAARTNSNPHPGSGPGSRSASTSNRNSVSTSASAASSTSQKRYSAQQMQQMQQQKREGDKERQGRASLRPDTVLNWIDSSEDNDQRRASVSKMPEAAVEPPLGIATSYSNGSSTATTSTGTVIANVNGNGIAKSDRRANNSSSNRINNDHFQNGRVPIQDLASRNNISSSSSSSSPSPSSAPQQQARALSSAGQGGQHRQPQGRQGQGQGQEISDQQRSSVASSSSSTPASASASAYSSNQKQRAKSFAAGSGVGLVASVPLASTATLPLPPSSSSSSEDMSPNKLSKRRPNGSVSMSASASAPSHLRNGSSGSEVGSVNGYGHGAGAAAGSQLSLLDDDPFAKARVKMMVPPSQDQAHAQAAMNGEEEVVNFAGVGAGRGGVKREGGLEAWKRTPRSSGGGDDSSVNTMVTAVEKENSFEAVNGKGFSPSPPPPPPKDDEEYLRHQGYQEQDVYEQQQQVDYYPPPRSTPSPEAYRQARSQRRGGKPEPPVAELSTIPPREDRPSEPFPLILFIKRPALFKQLLEYMSFWDWCILSSVSRKIRGMLVKEPGLREVVLERFLRTIGYQRWSFEDPEPLSVSLQDLHDYMRGVSTPTHEYARVADMYVHSLNIHPNNRDPTLGDTVRQLTAATRAYSRVVLRLRAQAEKEASVQAARQRSMKNANGWTSPSPSGRGYATSRGSSRAPSPTRSTFSQSRDGHPPLPSSRSYPPLPGQTQQQPQGQISGAGVANTTTFKSPLFRLRRAPLLRVFVPSPEGDWLSDKSVLECEAECRRAGISHLMRLGDVVWDVAVGDEGNVGRLVWDGMYLIDLDYSYSTVGDLPKYLPTFAFPPSYFHRVVRTGPGSSNPIAYLDIGPWGEEIAMNLQLIQDRVRTETPQGAYHNVVRWVHRSSFTIRPPSKSKRIPIPESNLFVDSGWYGTVMIETEGTNEALADLHDRCGPGAFPPRPRSQPMSQREKENKKVFRILREKSRPGEIWIRTVGIKERLQ